MDTRHPRREVSIETRLFLPSANPKILPCRIVNVSKGGVKVQIFVNYLLPSRLIIMRAEHENMYECRTAWQVGQTAGLAFVSLCARAKHQEVIEEMKTARIINRNDPSLHLN